MKHGGGGVGKMHPLFLFARPSLGSPSSPSREPLSPFLARPRSKWSSEGRAELLSFIISQLQTRLSLRAKQLREKREKEEQERRSSLSSNWSPNGTACEAWDWFQGRSDDGRDYTTLRSREYGYVVQLYDNTELAWFQVCTVSLLL